MEILKSTSALQSEQPSLVSLKICKTSQVFEVSRSRRWTEIIFTPRPSPHSTSSYDCGWSPLCLSDAGGIQTGEPRLVMVVSLSHNWQLEQYFYNLQFWSANNLILRGAGRCDWLWLLSSAWRRKLRINSSIVSNNNTGAGQGREHSRPGGGEKKHN